MQNWRLYARCRGMDPEWFFPLTESAESGHVRQVKAVCQACPVLEVCRRDALLHHDVHGIRGGMTGPEREDVLRSRAA